MYTSKTHEAMARALEQRQGSGFRKHLGASIIGRECARQIWYTFRWAWRTRFSARVLRLFDRGVREEQSLLQALRRAGVHAVDVDPTTGEQFRVSDHAEHFGGSLDAKLFDAPDFPGIWVLGEFKTHSNKSFNAVKKQGIRTAKFEHLVQMQIYMRYAKLPAALYFAVNKDNDELFIPTVEYDEAIAERYIARAASIIVATEPPPRVNDSPGWYLCKFCDYRTVCHEHIPKEKNCRTCIYARPIEAGAWFCLEFDYTLIEENQRRGCLQHTEIYEG